MIKWRERVSRRQTLSHTSFPTHRKKTNYSAFFDLIDISRRYLTAYKKVQRSFPRIAWNLRPCASSKKMTKEDSSIRFFILCGFFYLCFYPNQPTLNPYFQSDFSCTFFFCSMHSFPWFYGDYRLGKCAIVICTEFLIKTPIT